MGRDEEIKAGVNAVRTGRYNADRSSAEVGTRVRQSTSVGEGRTLEFCGCQIYLLLVYKLC